MISPKDWKKSIENTNTCKFIGEVLETKKEKSDNPCSLGNLYIKTKEGIYVKGDIYNGECIGGRFSFGKGNLPKVGETYHFFIGKAKTENNVINAIKGKYSERTGLIDFSKIPNCEVSDIGKEKYENVVEVKDNFIIFLGIFLISIIILHFIIKKIKK